jgi:hypothetical protein
MQHEQQQQHEIITTTTERTQDYIFCETASKK